MNTPKDNFSKQAAEYKKFRPHYPDALYSYLFSRLETFNTAWDCGTGNGQVALRLAEKFEKVYATDISAKQLSLAEKKTNIQYLQARAEEAPLPAASIDLITVAQAIHWFDVDGFYSEVKRLARPGALLAVWGYGLIHISEAIDTPLQQLYSQTLGPYWDAERKWVDDAYQHISFPFKAINAPEFEINLRWDRKDFMGYLQSWSSVQHYNREVGKSPLPSFEEAIAESWPEGEVKQVRFPIFLRLGTIC
jgi:SAM-dependent methyltransferase